MGMGGVVVVLIDRGYDSLLVCYNDDALSIGNSCIDRLLKASFGMRWLSRDEA